MTETERRLAAIAEATATKQAAEEAWRAAIDHARRCGIPLRAIAEVAKISPEQVRRLYRRPPAVDTSLGRRRAARART